MTCHRPAYGRSIEWATLTQRADSDKRHMSDKIMALQTEVSSSNEASATCLYPGPAQSSPYTHIPPPGDPS